MREIVLAKFPTLAEDLLESQIGRFTSAQPPTSNKKPSTAER